jgi:spore cortex formation protein SpoVR/YcgB (stage V sporulation)
LVEEETVQTLKQLRQLWGFDVALEAVDQNGAVVRTY